MKKEYQIFVDFMPFATVEKNDGGLCIWCKQDNIKNKAHIFSRRLMKSNHQDNLLKNSVCSVCNSKLSNLIEDWIYKYTPLSTWSHTMFSTEIIIKNYRYIPTYAYFTDLNEWLVIDYASNKVFFSQIYLANGIPTCFGIKTSPNYRNEVEELFNRAATSIHTKSYITHISDNYPDNFSPRFLFVKENIVLAGKNEGKINELLSAFLRYTNNVSTRTERSLGSFDISDHHAHYKWSKSKYLKLCMKIAFEMLARFKGAEFCLNQNFDPLRSLIFTNEPHRYTEVLEVAGKGLRAGKLAPEGFVAPDIDIIPEHIPCPKFIKSENSHDVILFAYGEYMTAMVKLFDIEPTYLILGKTERNLMENYAVRYDYINDSLIFLKSIRPMLVQFTRHAMTWRLRHDMLNNMFSEEEIENINKGGA